MTETITPLSYAVRLTVVAKYLGQLALMLAILTLAPLTASIVFGEYALTWRYALVIVILLLAAMPSWRIAAPTDLQTNEALTIVVLAFLLAPLLMTYPIMGAGLPFIDAWFEAVSAITTTGLSTVSTFEGLPRTFLFTRAWIQWYGGLGIVVLSIALLMGHHIAIKRLAGAESMENIVTTTHVYARRMLGVYLVLTALGLAVLWLLIGDGFIALTHTLAAVSTAGFSPLDHSLADLDSWAMRIAVIVVALSGAVPFALYFRLARGSWREVLADGEARTLLVLIAVVSSALSLALLRLPGFTWQDAMGHGFIMGVSAQTTTGFSSLDVSMLDGLAKGVLIVAMFIGGGMGSTAGGIKILRLLIVARLVQLAVRRAALPPHAVVEARLGGKILGNDEMIRALLLIIMFVVVIVLSWLVFLAFGVDAQNALFEVVSAACTVGLSSGVTTADLHPVLKVVLGLNMLLGRLEIIALLVVLYPGTWMGKRKG